MKIGYFGYLPTGEDVMGGAEVKTKMLLKALESIENIDIETFNIYKWRNRVLSVIMMVVKSLWMCDEIIFVVSTPFFLRFYLLLSVLNVKKSSIHFIPVGFSSPNNYKANEIIRYKAIKGIYVESFYNKKLLDKIGLDNVHVLHNFKYINIESEKLYEIKYPLEFCYCARVSEVKGILETINIFKDVNKEKIRCTLDIYGPIDIDIKYKFYKLIDENYEFISYKGILKPEKVAEVMQDYYMVIFPTKFEGEGFPGTIIDSFAAGTPLLSSKFRAFDELLIEQKNCIAFEFNNYGDMKDKLEYSICNTDRINEMRKHVKAEYCKYMPENEIKVILNGIK